MSKATLSSQPGSNHQSGRPHVRGKHIYNSLVIFAVALIIMVGWANNSQWHRDSSGLPNTGVYLAPATADLSVDDLKALDVETVTSMQREAAQRVGESIYSAEITGPITHRPAFISPVEWYVVKEVAERKADREKALTRLVNNFRFLKQMELWQAMTSGKPLKDGIYDVDQIDRRELAEHLLERIPTRLAANDMSKSQAQQAQMALIMDIETDPQRRHKRLREESQRIGVQFEINQRSAQH
jgi:hypothetical protein